MPFSFLYATMIWGWGR